MEYRMPVYGLTVVSNLPCFLETIPVYFPLNHHFNNFFKLIVTKTHTINILVIYYTRMWAGITEARGTRVSMPSTAVRVVMYQAGGRVLMGQGLVV